MSETCDRIVDRLHLFLGQSEVGTVTGSKRTGEGGRRVEVHHRGVVAVVVVDRRGGIYIEGTPSTLRSTLLAWAGLRRPPRGAGAGCEDFALGWREWPENAEWVKRFVKEHDWPSEDEAPAEFKINREIAFHDYMFRQRMSAAISAGKLAWVVPSWLDRYCFMQLDVEALLGEVFSYVRGSFSDYLVGEGDEQLIDLGIAAQAISNSFAGACASKFVRREGQYVCPQVGDYQHACTANVVDMLYPYSNAGDVVAYTKENLVRLMRRQRDGLRWLKLAPASPIEDLMARGMADANVLAVPQYQATGAGHRYRVDFAIRTSGPTIAVECDGLEFHARPAAYIRDQSRNRHLQRYGFYVMRFSSVEIYNDLAGCIREIDEAFWRIQRGKLSIASPPRTNYFGIGD